MCLLLFILETVRSTTVEVGKDTSKSIQSCLYLLYVNRQQVYRLH